MGPSERAAAVVVRAWLEAGHEPVLKVRVCELSGTDRLNTIGTASSVEAACQVIRAWLEHLSGQEAPVGDPRHQSDA